MVNAVIENAADRQNEKERDGRRDRGQGDIANLVPAICAVYLRCFVKFLRNRRDRRDIDDRAPSHAFDKRRSDDDSPSL